MYLTDDFSEETTTWISRNGENGFEGQFETVFSPEKLDKLFIIHGGPGTGKSTMMKKLSQEGVRTGARVEKVLCSSDPDSLDGVILCKNKKKVGIMDGTPPHGRLPKYPGCKEETVSLDRFWDASLLEKEKKRIPGLSKHKAQA
ncbi:MAG: hypothetical protein MJ078_04385 [Clostridia bacterium]|nr:hypothetical protein [Clostridia bacterium]